MSTNDVLSQEEIDMLLRGSDDLDTTHFPDDALAFEGDDSPPDRGRVSVGDVLSIELPDSVKVRVDGVPVMTCEFGSFNGARALLVKELIDHSIGKPASSSRFVKGHLPVAKESDDE